jgi:hypothetical protein
MGAFALGAMVSQIIIIRRFIENETAKHHHQNNGKEYAYFFLHVKLVFWILFSVFPKARISLFWAFHDNGMSR